MERSGDGPTARGLPGSEEWWREQREPQRPARPVTAGSQSAAVAGVDLHAIGVEPDAEAALKLRFVVERIAPHAFRAVHLVDERYVFANPRIGAKTPGDGISAIGSPLLV